MIVESLVPLDFEFVMFGMWSFPDGNWFSPRSCGALTNITGYSGLSGSFGRLFAPWVLEGCRILEWFEFRA